MTTLFGTYREVFGFVRREWRELFKTSGLLLVPNAIIIAALAAVAAGRDGAPPGWMTATTFVLGLIHHGVTIFTTGAVALFAASRMARMGWDWREVWRRALGGARSLLTSMLALAVLAFAAALVVGLPIGVGVMFLARRWEALAPLIFMVPFFIVVSWAMVRLAFLSAIAVIERKGGFEAISRSRALTKGDALRTFVLLLPVMLAGVGVGVLMGRGPASFPTALGMQLLYWVTASIQGTLVTYLYVQRRYESEGCDVGKLGEELARTATR